MLVLVGWLRDECYTSGHSNIYVSNFTFSRKNLVEPVLPQYTPERNMEKDFKKIQGFILNVRNVILPKCC